MESGHGRFSKSTSCYGYRKWHVIGPHAGQAHRSSDQSVDSGGNDNSRGGGDTAARSGEDECSGPFVFPVLLLTPLPSATINVLMFVKDGLLMFSRHATVAMQL